MIKEFKVEKALRDFLKSKVSLPVKSWDSGYKPSATDSYILEKCMLGNVAITLSQNDSETANGIYQIDIYSALEDSAFPNKFVAIDYRDKLKAYFTKGLTANIAHDGQNVIINQVNTPPMRMNEANTHRIYTLDVNFRVIG